MRSGQDLETTQGLDKDLLRNSLAGALPDVQEQLDQVYRERFRAAREIVAQLDAEPRALAVSLLPQRQVVTEMTIDSEVSLERRRSGELAIRILSFGYRRKYAHSGYVSSRLALTVRQAPLTNLEEKPDG